MTRLIRQATRKLTEAVGLGFEPVPKATFTKALRLVRKFFSVSTGVRAYGCPLLYSLSDFPIRNFPHHRSLVTVLSAVTGSLPLLLHG